MALVNARDKENSGTDDALSRGHDARISRTKRLDL
jgi:hypothetical protein